LLGGLAEREGFEPSVTFLLRSLSKGVLSTTQPPFLEAGREVSITGREARQLRRKHSSTIHRPDSPGFVVPGKPELPLPRQVVWPRCPMLAVRQPVLRERRLVRAPQ